MRIDERTGQTIAAVGNNGATTGHTFAEGDLNYDGKIDGLDAIIFSGHYDTGLAHLPEPSTFVLAGLGLASLLFARRRRAVKSRPI